MWRSSGLYDARNPANWPSDGRHSTRSSGHGRHLVSIQEPRLGSRLSSNSGRGSLAVSLISLAEIEYGMEIKNWGSSRRELMRRFVGRFTPLLPDTETAAIWTRIKSNCESKGRPIMFADAWIAAAAVHLNMPLVTHNATDYQAVEGLKVEGLIVVTAPTTIQSRERSLPTSIRAKKRPGLFGRPSPRFQECLTAMNPSQPRPRWLNQSHACTLRSYGHASPRGIT